MKGAYYISPVPVNVNSLIYSLSRAGISEKINRNFYVERAGKVLCSQIFCVLSGRGTFYYREQKYPYTAGDICIMKSGEDHRYSNESSEGMSIAWFEFYGGNSAEIVEEILEQSSPVIHGSIFIRIANLINSMVTKVTESSTFYQPSLEIYEILLEILRYGKNKEVIEISPSFVRDFSLLEEFVDKHLNERISNQTLADLCSMSLSYFNKVFQKFCRITPQQYIMRCRIARAKYNLTQTNDSLEEIADSLGFCNTGHFVRNFKKETGFSPAKYRKQYSFTYMSDIKNSYFEKKN